MSFERRGVSLPVVEVFRAAASSFGSAPRWLLEGGTTALALEPQRPTSCLAHGTDQDKLSDLPGCDEQVAVQQRSISPDKLVLRRAVSLPGSAIVRKLKAAVGDRVLLPAEDSRTPAERAEHESLVIKCEGDGLSRTMSSREELRLSALAALQYNRPLATVVEYDPDTDRYAVLQCTTPDSSHECNHTLGWSAAGASEVWIDASALDRHRAFTTKDACEELVKPLAAHGSLSVVEILARAQGRHATQRGMLTDVLRAGLLAPGFRDLLSRIGEDSDAHPRENANTLLVGDATVFDSHAWKYEFEALINALQLFQAGEETDSRQHFHWLDILTVNQDPTGQATLPQDYFYTTFKEGIQAIGHTLLVLSPWSAPLPLRRSWCLWEILCTIQDAGVRFSVQLSEAEEKDFLANLARDWESAQTALSGVDVRKAEAWKMSDQQQIAASVECTVGFAKTNMELTAKLREWYVAAGLRGLAQLRTAAGAPSAEITHLLSGVMQNKVRGNVTNSNTTGRNEKHVEELQKHEPEPESDSDCEPEQAAVWLKLQGELGVMLTEMARHAEAEPLLREAVLLSRQLLGVSHQEVATSLGNFGALMQAQGNFEEAKALLREAFELRREAQGEDHRDTLISMGNLGLLLGTTGEIPEAEKLLRIALFNCRETLGEDHRDTLISLNNLGLLLKTNGNLVEAEPLYREALRLQRVALGETHPSTLASLNNLGDLLHDQGKLAEAEPLHREALRLQRETLGEDHPHTLASAYNLADLLIELAPSVPSSPQILEAVAMLEEALAGRLIRGDTSGALATARKLLPLLDDLEVSRAAAVRTQLAEAGLSVESKWIKMLHGEQVVFYHQETGAFSLNPPACGVAAESPSEDATQFEQWVDWAAKYDSGYFNVTSLWAKFTQPAGAHIAAVYYHSQRGVFTTKWPLEGVQDEQVADPAKWAGYMERATQHDSNLELNATIDVDGGKMACVYGSGPAGAHDTTLVMVQPAYVEAEITNGSELCGSIAVAHRGHCSFDEKVTRVVTAGAVALVVVNTNDELFTPGGEDMGAWTIPVVGVTSSDGVRLASAATATLIVAPAGVPEGVPPDA